MNDDLDAPSEWDSIPLKIWSKKVEGERGGRYGSLLATEAPLLLHPTTK